ncbi:MAG: hypothetical protein JWQ96_2137 [Segetibacter sp.]|nr:hypothetical protein [Segetibacter sp.]
MKNLLVIPTFLVMLVGCSKEAVNPNNDENKLTTGPVTKGVNATVAFMGDPTLDGLGWVLMVDKTAEVPNNLTNNFKKEGMSVVVSFKRTNQPVPCRCADKKMYVEITSIAALAE